MLQFDETIITTSSEGAPKHKDFASEWGIFLQVSTNSNVFKQKWLYLCLEKTGVSGT